MMWQDDIKEYLSSQGVPWEESADLLEVASKCDVVYQTRIQRERFGDRINLYNEARGKYIVDPKVMSVLPEHGVVLHPLPRLDEVRRFCFLWCKCLITWTCIALEGPEVCLYEMHGNSLQTSVGPVIRLHVWLSIISKQYL